MYYNETDTPQRPQMGTSAEVADGRIFDLLSMANYLSDTVCPLALIRTLVSHDIQANAQKAVNHTVFRTKQET